MFKNYFVTAVRNLFRNKFYSLINILGLSIGLAVGIMILLWVQDELSYDRFHANASQIYKINSHLGSGAGEQVWTGAPAPVALYSKKKVPGVLNAVRIRGVWEMSLFNAGSNSFVVSDNAFVDPSFFNIFTVHFIKGDNRHPFIDANSVVITNSTAQKYFGNENPIGKVIVADGKENFTVSGVIRDFPENSTLHYNMLFPMDNYAKKFGGNGDWKTIDEDLGNYFYDIYLQLQPGTSIAKTEHQITKLFNEAHDAGTRFTLQPFTNMHLYAPDGNAGAMQTVKTFFLVAVLILLIACINYVNLSTARSMLRSKEVSVRKIIGAQKGQLFIQFILESTLLFIIGSAIAICLVKLLFPLFNEISGKQMAFSLADSSMWIVIGASVAGSLIVASIYPALLLSSFKPIEALKGKFSFGSGNVQFRKVLVVVQFVFSVALIISTIVIGMQLNYMKNKQLGYDKEHVFTIGIRQQMFDHIDAVRNQLLKAPGVLAVSSGDAKPAGGLNATTGDTDWEGKPEKATFLIHATAIDQHFIPLFNMHFADGTNFTGAKGDSAHIILNETAVREAGIKDPVGKRFRLWSTEGTIIGVVKDFNYASLRQRIEPMAFYYQPSNWRMFIKTNGRDANKAIAAAQALWQQYTPDYPFNYTFVDEDYNALYKNEQRTGKLFNIFSFVAIVISCLGLFGLAAYTAQVKTKEIGIRKVLGATVGNIVQLLAKDFISLVVIALVIAIPIGWWAMNLWLQDFAFRINVSWWIFVSAGVIAILVALFTVSTHAIKAALANPVVSLKEE